ncbi:MAG: potassium transporter TrkG [Dysosmobacter sp.]
MNTRMIGFLLGRILMVEAGLLALPLLTALLYGEPLMPWLATMLVLAAIGGALSLRKPERTALYAKDGFAAVALVWLLMSAFGALPFVLSGDIPNYIDAFFETVSGFTTTGASILTAVEPLSRGGLFWRSFTHWVGGMGVLVFVMAILPMSDGHTMHILRAEMPGPTAGKLVSRMSDTAKILYGMYFVMTLVMIVTAASGRHGPFRCQRPRLRCCRYRRLFQPERQRGSLQQRIYRRCYRYRDAGLRHQLQSVLLPTDAPLPGRGQVRGAMGVSGHRGLFHRYHRGQHPPSVRRGGDFSAPRLFSGVLHHHHHRLCYGGF